MKLTQINSFLREDAPAGDITTRAIFGRSGKVATGEIIAKEPLVVSGMEVVSQIVGGRFRRLKLVIRKQDGSRVRAGTVLARLKGPVTDILTAERLCLNFLGHLSGIATLTARFVARAKGSRTRIFDTRKTTPGLREVEKKAVRDGGGENHRKHLSDHYLIKDNHIQAAGSVTAAIRKVRRHQKRSKNKKKIEVEVRNLREFQEALALVPDIILLDNMSPAMISRAVVLRNGRFRKNDRPVLEVSGGVSLKNLGRYLHLGVERISVGALTHSARAVDIAMEIKESR